MHSHEHEIKESPPAPIFYPPRILSPLGSLYFLFFQVRVGTDPSRLTLSNQKRLDRSNFLIHITSRDILSSPPISVRFHSSFRNFLIHISDGIFWLYVSYVAQQRNMHASNIAFLYLFAVMCDELFQLINPRFLDMKMKLCRNQNKKKAKLWKENIHDIMLNFISASHYCVESFH